MIKGLAKHTGIEVVDIEGATGFYNTNYSGKVKTALAELEKKDVVFLHISAGEEVSLKGSIDDKIHIIEDFDSEHVGFDPDRSASKHFPKIHNIIVDKNKECG